MARSREVESKRLFSELWLVMNQITRGVEAQLKPFGLTHGQFQILLNVEATPDISQRELSERLNVTTGNVSMLVSKLEGAGLLDRIPAGAAYHLRMTPAGHRRMADLAPVRQRLVADLFGHVPVDDLARTADTLAAVRHG